MSSKSSNDNSQESSDFEMPDNTLELWKCYMCDCERYPFCNVMGEVCQYCFDIQHFEHKIPIKEIPGKFHKKKCGPHCQKSASYTPKNPKFKLISSKGNGDCLYESVENAFNSSFTIEDLRNFVSFKQNPDTFDAYKNIGEYKMLLENAEDYHDFRHLLQKTGAEHGITDCVWGDENTLYYLSNELGVTFVIFNQKGSLLQKIEPEHEFCKRRYITLHLNNEDSGREHYDLLVFDENKILNEAMWQSLLKMFKI